jgi:hypothetical protein
MPVLRNKIISLFLVVVALVNTAVLIINPDQFTSTAGLSYEISFGSDRDDIITTSYTGELFSPLQQIPDPEFRLKSNTIPVPVSGTTLYTNNLSLSRQDIILKPIAGFLPPGTMSGLNNSRLFILHRRLNT